MLTSGQAFPWISGAEFAGVVLATPSGEKNPKFPVGSRVFGATQGAYATKAIAWESSMLPVPEGWSFKEAAGLFVTAPTSYGALVVRAGVKAGDYVLVHAAAGGVGLAAVQSMSNNTPGFRCINGVPLTDRSCQGLWRYRHRHGGQQAQTRGSQVVRRRPRRRLPRREVVRDCQESDAGLSGR